MTGRSVLPWPKSDDGTVAVFRVDPSRISCHEAKRRIKAFLHQLSQDGSGMKTRTVTVEIPHVDLTELQWPEAILVAHLAFGTPFPLAAEDEFELEPDESGRAEMGAAGPAV
jgi:hypothetical protein